MTKSTLQITYIGHATLLIESGEDAFLTDPNFSKKILNVQHRVRKPGMTPEALPPLTACLVSHARYQHLDIFSFKYFPSNTSIIVPQGLGKFVRKFLPNPVTEIGPAGCHQGLHSKIHAVPVAKQGFRWVPIRHRTATGYLLETPGGNVYFPGNTTYGPHFTQTGHDFDIDVALLPTRPWKKGQARGSLSPEQTMQAFQDLGARFCIPYLWDSFGVQAKEINETLEELRAQAGARSVDAGLQILQPGESFELPTLKAVALRGD